MGATSQHRDKGMSDREFFGNEFFLGNHRRILECATMPAGGGEWQRVFYAAVENGEDAAYEPGRVWALVVLMHWSRADYFNFTYKDMSETMGPGEDTCPAKILDLLSPTDSEWANQWRERCRTNAARREAARQVKHGDVVRFAQPITFANDCSASRFRFNVDGRRRYWTALPDDSDYPRFSCRLGTEWWQRNFTKETAA